MQIVQNSFEKKVDVKLRRNGHARQSESRFRFRRIDRIGSNDAQEDTTFLFECFVNKNNELDLLCDLREPECIVVGRTGVGKTALLFMLNRREEKVTELSLDDLALSHLSNSPALRLYMDLELNMDLFFRVLWRHVFAVELINLFGTISGSQGITSLFQRIQNMEYRKPYQKRARDYLAKYPEFWKDTEVRIKEEVERINEDFNRRVGTELRNKLFTIGGEEQYSAGLSQEERTEIESIGRQVVNQRQMQELSSVIKLLSEELQYDGQKRYFITIDKLDTKWSEDPLRYKLIRALMETVRDLNHQIGQLKIVLAIREDLLERVFPKHTSNMATNLRSIGHFACLFRGIMIS